MKSNAVITLANGEIIEVNETFEKLQHLVFSYEKFIPVTYTVSFTGNLKDGSISDIKKEKKMLIGINQIAFIKSTRRLEFE